MDPTHTSRPPICPRCIYDLSGETSRWAESCPVEGLCPECGLQFEWKHIFFEPLAPDWWIERDAPRFVRRAAGTLMRSFFPPAFWKCVRLEIQGNLRVSAALFILVLLLWWIAEVAASASTLHLMQLQSSYYSGGSGVAWRVPYWPFGVYRRNNTLWTLYFAICFPLAIAVLPETRRRAKVAWTHIWRVFIFATAPAFIGLSVLTALGGAIVLLDTLATSRRSWLTQSPWANICFSYAPLLSIMMISLSWIFATSRYLRLRHALFVAISLIVISGLLPLTIYACTLAIRLLGFRGVFSAPW
ncbi:MAG: hypothetical protein ACREJD_03645 [Phycisphaerales bacterium]